MVRIKNRYLLVNILYPDSKGSITSDKVPDIVQFHQPTTDRLNAQSLVHGLRAQIFELFGDYGSGAVAGSLAVKYFSAATSTFILRVSRAHYRLAWAALSFMKSLPIKNGEDCVFRVVRVSGTIRKAEEEAIRRAREMILRARRELGDQNGKALEKILGQAQDIPQMDGAADVPMDSDAEQEEEEAEMTDGDG